MGWKIVFTSESSLFTSMFSFSRSRNSSFGSVLMILNLKTLKSRKKYLFQIDFQTSIQIVPVTYAQSYNNAYSLPYSLLKLIYTYRANLFTATWFLVCLNLLIQSPIELCSQGPCIVSICHYLCFCSGLCRNVDLHRHVLIVFLPN